MTVRLTRRPPTDKQLTLLAAGRYFCDWGDCEARACWFRSHDEHGWLPVCAACAMKP